MRLVAFFVVVFRCCVFLEFATGFFVYTRSRQAVNQARVVAVVYIDVQFPSVLRVEISSSRVPFVSFLTNAL